MRAYHFLEKNHYVHITEAGHFVTVRDKRVKYHITLDEKEQHWVYYRFSKKRNSIGEFDLKEGSSQCAVYADFEQVSKFNY